MFIYGVGKNEHATQLRLSFFDMELCVERVSAIEPSPKGEATIRDRAFHLKVHVPYSCNKHGSLERVHYSTRDLFRYSSMRVEICLQRKIENNKTRCFDRKCISMISAFLLPSVFDPLAG